MTPTPNPTTPEAPDTSGASEFNEDAVKAKIKSDTFWGDLANALVLSPVHREPFTPTRKEVRDFDTHAELATLLIPVLSETNSDQWAAYEAGRIARAILDAGYRRTK